MGALLKLGAKTVNGKGTVIIDVDLLETDRGMSARACYETAGLVVSDCRRSHPPSRSMELYKCIQWRCEGRG